MGLLIEVNRKIKRHINKKREAHPSLASRFKAPENCPCCRNEQLRTSRRYRYINPYTPVMPTVRIHHRPTSIIGAVYIQHTQRNSSLLCSWQHWNFLRTSNRQNQSVRIRYYPYVCPHHLYFMTKHQREDIAKIAIYTKKQTYILEKTFSLRITKFFERKNKMQKNRKKMLITTYNP